jgi:hypothetical protein
MENSTQIYKMYNLSVIHYNSKNSDSPTQFFGTFLCCAVVGYKRSFFSIMFVAFLIKIFENQYN